MTAPVEAPGKGTFKAANHARRRAEILDAAAAVFAEVGYMRASTSAIAARLGMRQSNLYYYFSSKDEALAEICIVALDGYIRRMTAILDGEGNFEEKLRLTLRAHLHILTQRPEHYVTFLTCRHDLPDGARREVGKITRAYEALVERLMAEGVANGEVSARCDVKFAASSLFALCHNPAIYRDGVAEDNLDRLADTIADLFLNGVVQR